MCKYEGRSVNSVRKCLYLLCQFGVIVLQNYFCLKVNYFDPRNILFVYMYKLAKKNVLMQTTTILYVYMCALEF